MRRSSRRARAETRTTSATSRRPSARSRESSRSRCTRAAASRSRRRRTRAEGRCRSDAGRSGCGPRDAGRRCSRRSSLPASPRRKRDLDRSRARWDPPLAVGHKEGRSMNSVSIAFENKSSVLTDAEVQAAIPALQHQVSYDFKPYWNEGARLVWVPSGSSPPTGAGSWLLSILDDSDQAGALGYHDVTADNTPLMKVFAKTDRDNNLSWTVTASHEILETLADPWINSAWQTSNTEFVALEVGDPVEADELGYTIDGVLVSDFILPAWFVSGLKVPKYRVAGHLHGPPPV